jgi:hypothetical protein
MRAHPVGARADSQEPRFVLVPFGAISLDELVTDDVKNSLEGPRIVFRRDEIL